MHLSFDLEIQHFGQVLKQFLLKKLGRGKRGERQKVAKGCCAYNSGGWHRKWCIWGTWKCFQSIAIQKLVKKWCISWSKKVHKCFDDSSCSLFSMSTRVSMKSFLFMKDAHSLESIRLGVLTPASPIYLYTYIF